MFEFGSRVPKAHALNEDEIEQLFDDIAGSASATHITFAQLEAKLHKVHEELAPTPPRSDPEAGNGLHAFLVGLFPILSSSKESVDHIATQSFQISKPDFIAEVRGWDIPSPDQNASSDTQAAEADAVEYEKKLPLRRRSAAHWSVQGPTYLFMTFVVTLQISCGLWQGLTYVTNHHFRHALGWGVIFAKFSAGALYPTLFFFMLISMSRWISTWLRRSYTISRFINADFQQNFHVRMSIVGLLLATFHAIGHMTGTFLYSSRPGQEADVLAAGLPFRSYRGYITTLPGWSGIIALGIFWLIALLSAPAVRRWNFEVFQIGHLLMFPMIGFLAAHGTARLFQGPMLGYWLVFPTIVVLLERIHRLYRSVRPIPARLLVLDDETVCVTAKHPRGKDWQYNAGQYILLQIPRLSFFQFHPFTISACVDDCLQVHIKTNEGDWTSALRELALQVGPDSDVGVGIDGPFGAPAQRFYDYQKSIIVGSGIGVTPFAGILTHMEQKALQGGISPWRQKKKRSYCCRTFNKTIPFPPPAVSRVESCASSLSGSGASRSRRPSIFTSIQALREAVGRRGSNGSETVIGEDEKSAQGTATTDKLPRLADNIDRRSQRRVDFIWLVRDKTHLLWFSALLNRVTDLAGYRQRQRDEAAARQNEPPIAAAAAAPPEPSNNKTDEPPVDLRINTFITAKRKDISTHVFRILLDRYRSDTSPVSARTGRGPCTLTIETMDKERSNPPFDVHALSVAMHGTEAALKLKERFMLELSRDPVFYMGDWVDLSKDQVRERTMQKIAALVYYVMNETVDVFTKRMELIGMHDPGFWTRFGVHYGLFLRAIRGSATSSQFSYWMEKGVISCQGMYGCFAMTELAHGSNVAGLETTATFDEKTDQFVIHTPNLGATKWWIGGAAQSATHCSVFAQLIVNGKKYGTKTFIVPLRDPKSFELLPGINVGDIGKKMGRDGIDNGFIQFTNVRIPRAYMLMKHTQVTRDGEVREPPLQQLTYGALLQGRTAMVADAANTAKKALTIATRYAAVRRQFKASPQAALETQILDYPIHQRRLMPLRETSYCGSGTWPLDYIRA